MRANHHIGADSDSPQDTYPAPNVYAIADDRNGHNLTAPNAVLCRMRTSSPMDRACKIMPLWYQKWIAIGRPQLLQKKLAHTYPGRIPDAIATMQGRNEFVFAGTVTHGRPDRKKLQRQKSQISQGESSTGLRCSTLRSRSSKCPHNQAKSANLA